MQINDKYRTLKSLNFIFRIIQIVEITENKITFKEILPGCEKKYHCTPAEFKERYQKYER